MQTFPAEAPLICMPWLILTSNVAGWVFCFVWFESLHPINNLSVKQGWVFLGWTITKLGWMCLAQGLQRSDASEARTRSLSVLRKALSHWDTALHIQDGQGRAWGQIESTQGVGMGGGYPLPYVRKKIKIWTKWWLLLHFLILNTDLIVSKTKVKNSQNPIALVQDYWKIGILRYLKT